MKGLESLKELRENGAVSFSKATISFTYLAFTKRADIIEKELKALEIIKECLVSEFNLFEKDGEYFILFYFDEIHELTFKLKNKEEYDLLKEALL